MQELSRKGTEFIIVINYCQVLTAHQFCVYLPVFRCIQLDLIGLHKSGRNGLEGNYMCIIIIVNKLGMYLIWCLSRLGVYINLSC